MTAPRVHDDLRDAIARYVAQGLSPDDARRRALRDSVSASATKLRETPDATATPAGTLPLADTPQRTIGPTSASTQRRVDDQRDLTRLAGADEEARRVARGPLVNAVAALPKGAVNAVLETGSRILAKPLTATAPRIFGNDPYEFRRKVSTEGIAGALERALPTAGPGDKAGRVAGGLVGTGALYGTIARSIGASAAAESIVGQGLKAGGGRFVPRVASNVAAGAPLDLLDAASADGDKGKRLALNLGGSVLGSTLFEGGVEALRWAPDISASFSRVMGDKRGFLGRTSAAGQANPGVQAVLAQGNVPTTPQTLWRKSKDTVKRAYQRILDDVYAAREFGRTIGGGEDLSDALSTARGSGGLAEEILGIRQGQWTSVANPTGITLRYARAKAKGIEGDVIAYTRAKRAIELDDAGMGWKASTFDRPTADAVVAAYAGNQPVLEAATSLTQFYDGLLEMRRNAGLLDDVQFNDIKAKHPSYVPFVRDFGLDDPFLGGRGTGAANAANATSGVRKMEAGDARAAIVDPYEQAIRDAQSTARDVLRQRAMQVVSDIVVRDPTAAAPFIREVPAGSGGREGRVFKAVVNGKQKSYEVMDDDLFESLAATAPKARGWGRALLGAPAKVFRYGITITPDFGVRNAVRDAGFTSTVYGFPKRAAASGALGGAAVGAATDEDNRLRGAAVGAGLGLGGGIMAKHAARIAAGMGHVLKNDDLYRQWLAEGGSGGTGFFVRSQADAQRVLKDLQRDGVAATDLVNPKRWLDGLRLVNEFVEQAPRVARYADQVAGGATPMSAAASARDVSVDFSRGGSDPVVGLASTATAFFNPRLQGWDKIRRTYSNPKAWGMGVATLTAPTLALLAINKDDPAYWEVPLWQRNLFWLVPSGKHDDGSTRFLRVPKPFEPGYVFASIPERLAEFAFQKNPAEFQAAMKDILAEVSEGIVPEPTITKAAREVLTGKGGYDMFRGRDIVPRGLQEAPAEEQVFPHTTNTARGIGRLTGTSPIKVDHLIRGYGGTAAAHLTQAVDPLLQEAGVDKRPPMPERKAAEQPLIRSFFTQPESMAITASTDAMWRQYDRGKPFHDQAVSMLEDAGDDPVKKEAALAYARQHRDAILGYGEVKGAVDVALRSGRLRREILASRTMTPSEKRAALQRLGKATNQVAKSAITPTP